uniref:Disease resistance R13L4/SHOC-2-like LRR domain-containing protein n=1 Tax=Glycine max TaxID=3847 RepID=A0A0R0ITA4_SOYBN
MKSKEKFLKNEVQLIIAYPTNEVHLSLELLSKENFEQKLGGGVGRGTIHRPFGIPANPESTVGLDTPLCKLCWDEQVKGKFRENILFVTFSKTPNLKIIVEILFEHYGYQVPDFQSDEEAVKRLGLLLRKIEGSSMLLFLDDVWPVSEALVKKFQVLILDSKILVTTRVGFPRLGTQCILKPLVHDDAITLFRHYASLEESCSSISEEVIQKVVKNCKGLPLSIKVIGSSLYNSVKECFRDLGLFPEDQRIPFTSLIDMWAELYGLDDDGIEAMSIINKLDSMNLANVSVERYNYRMNFCLFTRKNASDTDNYFYNNLFIEPIERRKRLIIEINQNKPECWLGEKSKLLGWRVKQKPQHATDHTLSISTDENCTSDWPLMMQLAQVEWIFVPSFVAMKNLKKLSLYTCNMKQAFENNHMLIPNAFPNLEELNIDHCKDMVALPKGLCDITSLKKLSITNCHKLSALPQEIGNLMNLELLSLSCCTDLEGIPASIGRLSNLRLMDISNCISLPSLPEDFGNLSSLQNLYMRSCARCELPFSVANLENLKVVVCDKEIAASWDDFKPMLPNLKIDTCSLIIVNLNWFHSISS